LPNHDIVVIGTSAGGLDVLQRLLGMLPADLPAALFIVQHHHPDSPSLLAQILQRSTPLTVETAADREPIEHGHVYVAPSDRHLLLEDGRVRVVHGPKENRYRPAIDPLFRSAAWTYGPRPVAMVLSGRLSDGAAGLWAVKTCGGVTVVQDPADAAYPGMPESALRTLDVDYCLALDDIGPLVAGLARQPSKPLVSPRPQQLRKEMDMVMGEKDTDVEDMNSIGRPSGFTCPACHGALWELQDGELIRYRCHIGHAYSSDSLIEEQTEAVEAALHSALRALEEHAATARRLSERYGATMPELSTRYAAQAERHETNAAVLRRVASGRIPVAIDPSERPPVAPLNRPASKRRIRG
jgi:two-component system chemotaxis response regulator CheB